MFSAEASLTIYRRPQVAEVPDIQSSNEAFFFWKMKTSENLFLDMTVQYRKGVWNSEADLESTTLAAEFS